MIHNDGAVPTGTGPRRWLRDGSYHAGAAGGTSVRSAKGIFTMPYLSKYHLSEQQAAALLGPVVDAVAELERRTQHHADRLAMSPADRDAVLAAHRVLAAARAEIEQIRAGDRASTAVSAR